MSRKLPIRHASTLLGSLAALLRVSVVGIFVVTFLVQTFRIPSESMLPTLQVGDFVLVSKTALAPSAERRGWLPPLAPSRVRRGDLIVFHFPPQPTRLLVKRVIGLPGDQLFLRGGRVFLNGEPLPEPYALYTPGRPDVYRDEFPNLHETDPDIDPAWWLALRRTLREEGAALPIPPGRYFVLGDNRNNSEDSRYWGFVQPAQFVGTPLLVYFAIPNGADAPLGALARLRWIAGWVRYRVRVLR